MTYKHLCPAESYQICALMKAGLNKTEIAFILNRHLSTISRELERNSGQRGYRPNQAQLLADSCGRSRNAPKLAAETFQVAAHYLRQEWSPEQVACLVPVSQETLYRFIYADKAHGGTLWRSLHCQKKKRKRYADGRDRRGAVAQPPLDPRSAGCRRKPGLCELLGGRYRDRRLVQARNRDRG